VVAHLLADQFDERPSDEDDDEAMVQWARENLRQLAGRYENLSLDDDARRLVANFLVAREEA
jgi:hypothetical protein